jgi:peptidoglycan/LPS O-acetylase OafA/YrhL
MPLKPSPSRNRRLRTDIQALRTIAVTLVVSFHLWPNRISGGFIGVDVFFVISGFLITKHILHEVEENRFSVLSFWARRIKRLLPASFTVLAATAIAIVLLAPVSLWTQWLGEIQSAVFYIQNWTLAGAAVDYLALANQASPVQHFWSLSTEEQFYFFWPLLVAGALIITTKALKPKASNRKTLLILFLMVTAASFIYSVYLTNLDPAVAYFSTPGRAWEFGIGAIAAFVPAVKKNSLRTALALVGLGGISVSALLITNQTPFPGLAAIFPTLGTFFVIIAAVEFGVISRIMALKPIQWIGDKSYAIYLWHWPILIGVPFVTFTALTLPQKLLIVLVTLLLAGLTERFIEKPIAKTQPTKAKVFALTATTSVFIASLSGLAINFGNERIVSELNFGKAGAVASHECFGAAARLSQDASCDNSSLRGVYPALNVAASDTPVLPDECFSVTREQTGASFCELGSRTGQIRVAAVGDSHLAQFAGALNVIALRNNWKMDMYAKGGCPFSYAVRKHDALLTKNCPIWVGNVSEQLEKESYDIIITSQRAGVEWVGGNGQAISGLSKLWADLVSSGNRIITIKDSPNPGQNNVACLLTGAKCKFERSSALKFDPQLDAASSNPQVTLIDFDNVYCDATECLPVIGNAVVYRDDNHLTDTFARTLAPAIESEIFRVLTVK